MLQSDEINALAELARIDLSKAERQALGSDLQKILAYVDEIKAVKVSAAPDTELAGERVNIWREDGEPHASGLYTDELLAAVPAVERGYVKVKKIIGE